MSDKNELIRDYSIELAEPGCVPGTGRWGAVASLNADISEVFPYLNSVLPEARYDHENKTLIFTEAGQLYALRPREIRLAHVEDIAQARDIIGKLVARINRVWQDREGITPRFTEPRLAPVLDIFKLLPKTNCRRCGYLTCMAFAADLRKGAAKLESCPPLMQNGETREKLSRLISGD
ncbi:MAG: (Fe-S)-binding protein [Dehalococcoidales bacterium]|nr:(Fe-S)-binding protein [Dehalococcoidales bacterium]